MHSLAAAGTATLDPGLRVRDLTPDEQDSVVGGVDVVGWILVAFTGSVVVGILDRILFGGCHCR